MQTISLPTRVVQKVLNASAALEELEDCIIARHAALVKKLRQARREHLAGKTRPFSPSR